jgi:predicted secreted protein
MATTEIINGTSLIMYIGDVAVGSATSHTLSLQMATRNATTKSSAGWAAKLSGLRSWTAGGGGFVCFADTYGYEELLAAAIARTAVTVKLSTEVSGDTYYSGSGYFTGVDLDSPVEESCTYTFTIEGTGALTPYVGT